jgi:hypothetical protein
MSMAKENFDIPMFSIQRFGLVRRRLVHKSTPSKRLVVTSATLCLQHARKPTARQ